MKITPMLYLFKNLRGKQLNFMH